MITCTSKELRLNPNGVITCTLIRNLPPNAHRTGELQQAATDAKYEITKLGGFTEVIYDAENKFIAFKTGENSKVSINFSGVMFGSLSSRFTITLNHKLKDLENQETADRVQALYTNLGIFTEDTVIDWSKIPRESLTWDYDHGNVITKNFNSKAEARSQLMAIALKILKANDDIKVTGNLLVSKTIELKVQRELQSAIIKNSIEEEGAFNKLDLYVAPDETTYMGQNTATDEADLPFINEIQEIIGLDFVRETLHEKEVPNLNDLI